MESSGPSSEPHSAPALDPFLIAAVGNTPLVRLSRLVPPGAAEVWLKLESGNPTGSYKDRMAFSVIGRALDRGAVGPGDRVVEYTGGSTGSALAFVCAGVGTGGALMGVLDGLDAAGVSCDVIALEPAQSPLLTTGTGGPHRVEGIGVGFEPPFLDRARCREIRTVDEHAVVATARRLAAEEGLLCGTSTGLNVTAAIEVARELGEGHRVVTFGCDSGSKYFGGDLFDE